ncbi:MAG: helix-turn-helix transcriptional regulator [Clostridiales bacterium]|nr:helix-turn-helix transcriptional regulator [Clostridiales bacterium]
MYNSTTVAENIKKAAKDKNILLQDLFTNCGLGKNTIANLKNGSMPKADNLAKIADYLDCSVDYLLGREHSNSINIKEARDNIGVVGQANAPVTIHNSSGREMSAQEKDLLRIYNNVDGKTQMKIMNFIYDMEEGN